MTERGKRIPTQVTCPRCGRLGTVLRELGRTESYQVAWGHGHVDQLVMPWHLTHPEFGCGRDTERTPARKRGAR